MRPHRSPRAAVGALMALVASFFAVGLGATASAGSQSVVNACQSNATLGWSDIEWTITGDAAPNPASTGGTVTLSNGVLQGVVPADLLLAGFNLGLLGPGENNIPTEVFVARAATNSDVGGGVAGTAVQVDSLSFVATTTIDPAGPSATPIVISEPLPDFTVTPTGGTVQFSQAAAGSLPPIVVPTLANPTREVQPAGSIFTKSEAGFIQVTFDCQPGSAVVDGPDGIPGNGDDGTTFDPISSWPPFVEVVVNDTTTTTTGGTSTTTTTSTTVKPTTTTTTSTTVKPTTTTTAPTTTTTTTAAPTTTTTAPSITSTPVTGSANYQTTCTNSVTPDESEIGFSATATAPSDVAAGSTASLTKQAWTVDVPASVLNTGINLGLISVGDVLPGEVTLSVFASNTVEGNQSAGPISVSIGPIPDAGGGQASDTSVAFNVPDLSWTATGGTIGYRLSEATILVTIDPLKVTFSCTAVTGSPSIVTTAASGSAGTPANEVLGSTTGGSTGGTSGGTAGGTTADGTLARTGSNSLMLAIVAAILLDLGYLMYSAAKPARRVRY